MIRKSYYPFGFIICLIFLIPFHLKSQVNLDQGLVVCLPFNGNTLDKSGLNNNGQNHGAKLTTDRFGNDESAFHFNGSDSYIEIPHSQSLNVEEVSIVMWVKATEFKTFPNSSGIWPKYAGPISKDLGSTGNWSGFSTTIQHGRMRFNNYFTSNEVGDVYKDNIINLNEWYFLVFTVQNGVLSIYINGELIEIDDKFEGRKMAENNSSILIGKSIWYPSDTKLISYFTGVIDDINIYNRGLTLEEIAILHQGSNLSAVTFETSPQEPCFGEIVNISAQTIESNIDYNWIVDNVKVETQENFIEFGKSQSTLNYLVPIELIINKKEACLPPVSKKYSLDLVLKDCPSPEERQTLPTAFSPNSDGLNDNFDLSALSNLGPEKIVFFNRWGNKILTLSQPNLNWDGLIDNKPATIGSYNFIITLASGEKMKGSVFLLR